MRKLAAILLIAVCAFSLVSCGGEPAPDQVINNKDDDPAPAPGSDVKVTDLYFIAEGKKIRPGTAADSAVLDKAASVYEIPSCAFEGNDTVYGYPSYEITVCNVNGKAMFYSVYILEPDVSTPEGLALGDKEAKVTELYGTDYSKEGLAYIYSDGSAELSVIVENGNVASIEYLMITD